MDPFRDIVGVVFCAVFGVIFGGIFLAVIWGHFLGGFRDHSGGKLGSFMRPFLGPFWSR